MPGTFSTKNKFSAFFALKFGADLFWIIYGLASFFGFQILVQKDSTVDPAMMWIPFLLFVAGLTCLLLNIYNYFSYLVIEPEGIQAKILFTKQRISYGSIEKISYHMGWLNLKSSEGRIILRIYKNPDKCLEEIQKRVALFRKNNTNS